MSTTNPTATTKSTLNVPPPPHIPSYLAPQTTSKEFQGYKLSNEHLTYKEIPLSQPVNLGGTAVSGSTNTSAPSFLTVQAKLKTQQLVILHSDDTAQAGAHGIYYVDHTGIWQLDPPLAQAGGTTNAINTQTGGSHEVYHFDSPEDGEGLSFYAVSPCFLVLTRGGGRLTIFHAMPKLPSPPIILFDGAPLSPPPLTPHHATCVATLLDKSKSHLYLVLYEFFEEHTLAPSSSGHRSAPLQFVHEGDALRTAQGVGSPVLDTHMEVRPGQANLPVKHAIHKLTAVTFKLRSIPSFAPTTTTSEEAAKRNDMTDTTDTSLPGADLVHTFSSLSNHRLPKADMPQQYLNDHSWSAPLACWLEIPNDSIRPQDQPIASSTTATATPPSPPFLWFVLSRVPYLNETESIVYELQRQQADAMEDAREARQPLETIPQSAASSTVAAAPASTAATPSMSPLPPFTSDKIESTTHNLKNYNVDAEDDDTEMDELGIQNPFSSLNPILDVSIQLYDPLGNLLAKRSFKQQQFLFHHLVEGSYLRRPLSVVGVKQGDDLLLYSIHSAPQSTPDGLSLGAAGAIAPSSGSSVMPVLRVGIVLKPTFSFAGLGYVQSGKRFKKFFCEDGTHSYIILSEFTRHIYVYGRPTTTSNTAAHWLIQLPPGEGDEDSPQILGIQTVVVPMPIPSSSTDDDNSMKDVTTTTTLSAHVQGQPLLYVLTRRSCRQYQLPITTLPA